MADIRDALNKIRSEGATPRPSIRDALSAIRQEEPPGFQFSISGAEPLNPQIDRSRVFRAGPVPNITLQEQFGLTSPAIPDPATLPDMTIRQSDMLLRVLEGSITDIPPETEPEDVDLLRFAFEEKRKLEQGEAGTLRRLQSAFGFKFLQMIQESGEILERTAMVPQIGRAIQAIAMPEKLEREFELLGETPAGQVGEFVAESIPTLGTGRAVGAGLGGLIKLGQSVKAIRFITKKFPALTRALVPAAEIATIDFLVDGDPGQAAISAGIGFGVGAPVIKLQRAGGFSTVDQFIRESAKKAKKSVQEFLEGFAKAKPKPQGLLPASKSRMLMPFQPLPSPVIALPGEFPVPAIIQPGARKILAITGENAIKLIPEETRVIFSGSELLSIESSARAAGKSIVESTKTKKLILKAELATPKGKALLRETPKEKVIPDLRTQSEIVQLRLRQNYPELSDALNSQVAKATIDSAVERATLEADSAAKALLNTMKRPVTTKGLAEVQLQNLTELVRPKTITPRTAPISTPAALNKFRFSKRVTRPIANGSKISMTEPGVFITDPSQWRDLNWFTGQFKDIIRAVEKVVPDKDTSRKILDFLVRPRELSVQVIGEEKLTIINQVKKAIVDDLGIGLGSKEDRAVIEFARGIIDLPKLKKDFPNKWNDIVRARDWLGDQFDNGLVGLSRLNQVQKKFNNPITPRKPDYMPQILDSVNIYDNILGAERGFINELSISQRLNRPFNMHNLKQTKKLTKKHKSAIDAFIDYSGHVLNEIHLTEHTQRMRAFSLDLGKRTDALPTFLGLLEDNARQLAGIGSKFDEALLATPILRQITLSMRAARRTLGRSLILGNSRSVLMQSIPMKNLSAEIGFSKSIKASYAATADWMGKDFAGKNSAFIANRYADVRMSRIIPVKFKDRPLRATVKNMDDFGAWMFLHADEMGVRTIWSGLYDDFLRQGLSDNPIKASKIAARLADEKTLKLVGGRSVGEIPPVLNHEWGRTLFQFQLEVNNDLQFLIQDIGKNPIKLGKAFIGGFLLNELFDRTIGVTPTFDPIGASWDAYQIISNDEPEGNKPVLAVGRIGGEVLGNIPGGQILASWYPKGGKTIFGWKAPTRQQIFARTEAGRFGPVPAAEFKKRLENSGRSLKDFARMLALFVPAGTPMVRTAEGIVVASTGEVKDSKGKLMFKVKGVIEQARAIVFGPFSTKEGQKFLSSRERKKKPKLFTGN